MVLLFMVLFEAHQEQLLAHHYLNSYNSKSVWNNFFLRILLSLLSTTIRIIRYCYLTLLDLACACTLNVIQVVPRIAPTVSKIPFLIKRECSEYASTFCRPHPSIHLGKGFSSDSIIFSALHWGHIS
jgi:hypothetical protein